MTTHRSRSSWILASALSLFFLLPPPPVIAQLPGPEGFAAGQVLEAVTSLGIQGAFLRVTDGEGRIVGRGFSGQQGFFALQLPAGGPYQLVVESMGFRDAVSDSLMIPVADTLHLEPTRLAPDTAGDPFVWAAGSLLQVLAHQDYPTILVLSALNRAIERGEESALEAALPLIGALTQGARTNGISPALIGAAATLQRCRSTLDPVEGALCSLEALLPVAPPALGQEMAEAGAQLVALYLRPGETAPAGIGTALAGGVSAAMAPFQRFAEETLHDAWHLRSVAVGQGDQLSTSFDEILSRVVGFSPSASRDEILAELPDLRTLLSLHPFVSGVADGARGPQAVLREYQSFLNSMTGSLGQSLAAIEDRSGSLLARAGDDPLGSAFEWATQRSFVYLASHSATLAGLDSNVAERIRTLGNAAADLQRSASSFHQNLLLSGRQVAMAALSGNVLGVAANITAFLGVMPGGMGLQAAGEIRALRDGIDGMHRELALRFDDVDIRFDEVFEVLDDRFVRLEFLVSSSSLAVRDEIQAIHTEVLALGHRIDRLEENVQSYMQAGFDRDYNRTLVRCLEHRDRYLPPFDRMEFPLFSECLADLRTRAVRDARDALLTDQVTSVDDAAVIEAFQDQSVANLARRLPLLGRVAEQRFGYPGLRGGRGLANPVEWAVASQAYLTMLHDWPGHARSVSPGDLEAMRSVGLELQDVLRSLAGDPAGGAGGGLLHRVQTHYDAQVALLTAEADVLAQRHRQAQLRRVSPGSILNRIAPMPGSEFPGGSAPMLEVPARVASAVPQEVRTGSILALGEASLVYRLTFEDRVVHENFRRRLLIFGRRHDRLTSTRTRIEVELRTNATGAVARHTLTGPWTHRLTEEMAGGEESDRVASTRVHVADPGAHFLREIWPVLSENASAWEIGSPSGQILASLERQIEEELRRHGSQAVDNVFTAVCWGDPAAGMSGADRESALRIRSALDALSSSRVVLQASARLAFPRAFEEASALHLALEGPESILDRNSLCGSFAAGENPLRLVWLEEEPSRRAAALAGALDRALEESDAIPRTLALVDTTVQQLDAAIRVQQLRTVVARAGQ